MKKLDKEIVGMIVLMIIAFIFLACGSLAWDLGEEGMGIFMIMGSLYLALWTAAGIVRDDVCAKLDEIKEEIGESGTVGKVH